MAHVLKLWAVICWAVALAAPVAAQPDRVVYALQDAVAAQPLNRDLRLRYSAALLRAGAPGAARHQVMLMLHESRSPAEMRQMLHALDQIDATDRWSFSVDGALLPSDNVNGVSTARSIDTVFGRLRIIDGGQTESGLGWTATARLSYRHVAGPGLRLTPGLAVSRIAYPENSQLDRWVITPELTLSLIRPKLTRSLKLYRRDQNYHGPSTGDEIRTGLRLGVSAIRDARFSWGGFLDAARIDRPHADYLDGTLTRAGGHVSYLFSDRLRGNLNAELTRRSARLDHNGYRGLWLSGGIDMALGGQELLSAGIGAGRRLYDADIPALQRRRGDTDVALTLGLQSARVQIGGASPRLSCTLSKTFSNVELYQTRATTCSLSLERQF